MKLIIGGAFQGKLDFAKRHFNLTDEQICDCEKEHDLSKPCIYHFEKYILSRIENSQPVDFVPAEDQIIICEDIFCGVVPVEPKLREWREETGRQCAKLSEKSDEVYRIFCGLEQRIK